VSDIPITEKLLLNARGWQAMKPGRRFASVAAAARRNELFWLDSLTFTIFGSQDLGEGC
jgi:hypothetical protein